MKEIILHVGLRKTGSTYLQDKIFPFLKDIAFEEPINRLIKQAFKEFDKNDEVFNGIKIEINNTINSIDSKKILLSNETFILPQGCTNEEFHRRLSCLKELFPKASILLVIRRQDKIFESLYKHVIRKEIYSGSMAHFVENIDNYKLFDYFKIMTACKEKFGNDNVKCIPYELLLQDPLDFVANICKLIGVGQPKNIEVSKERVLGGLSSPKLKSKLVYNKLYVKNKASLPFKLIRFLITQFLFKSTYIIDFIYFIKPKVMDDLSRKTIMENHKDSNEAIDKIISYNLKKLGYH